MKKTPKWLAQAVTRANDAIATSNNPEVRKAIASFIESMLLGANCYRGFFYIGWQKEGGYDRWVQAGEHIETIADYIGDETRRFYFC